MITYEEFVAAEKFPPTAEQRAVITSEHRATLVIAGAGSGKTATMANRIAWMLASKVAQPQEILGLTFTRKAAGELAERVTKKIREVSKRGLISFDGDVVSDDEWERIPENQTASMVQAKLHRPTITTYNSFASQIATSYAMLIGENPDSRLMNEAERYQLMYEIVENSQLREALVDTSLDTITRNALSLAAGIIDNDVSIEYIRKFLMEEVDAVNSILQPRMTAKTTPDKGSVERALYDRAVKSFQRKKVGENLHGRLALVEYVEQYFVAKKERSLIEFADQVSWATRILETVPEVRTSVQEAFPVVLLDEFQDTSVNQARFLKVAFSDARSVTAVGDPNQAIYGWRGASANAFADFIDDYQVTAQARLSLSQAFRNATSILDAANQLTNGKLSYGELQIKKLRPAPAAPAGEVIRIHRHYAQDTYHALAMRLADELRNSHEQKVPSIAVLVRNHSFEKSVIKALDDVGVPYEVIGGQSLIIRPEIRAVRALLAIADNPQRNDQLLYLLNFFGLGLNDLRHFSAVAEDVARAEQSRLWRELRQSAEEEKVEELKQASKRPAVSIVQALLSHDDFSKLSLSGQERIQYIARLVHQVQEQRHKPLSVVVSTAIDALDLYVYATTRSKGGAALKAALTGFIKLAGTYHGQEPSARLSSFLSWIDAMEVHEHAGEITPASDLSLSEEVTPQSGIVQVLTVNAAKGLEWDIVAVPELVEKRFDYIKRRYPLWHKNNDVFPTSLRADAHHVPIFSAQDYLDGEDLQFRKCEALIEYAKYEKAVKAQSGDEERRLAYVALTRPRRLLLLLTYDFLDEEAAGKEYRSALASQEGEGEEDSGTSKCNEQTHTLLDNGRRQSDADTDAVPAPLYFSNVFIEDLEGKLTPDRGYEEPFTDQASVIAWGEKHNLPAEEPKIGDSVVSSSGISWPTSVDREVEPYSGGTPIGTVDIAKIKAVWQETYNRLVEENSRQNDQQQGVQREYLTASDIVSLMSDAQEFYRDQRRPIPRRVSQASRIGTSVHQAIAEHFDSVLTLDIDSVLSPEEMPIDQDVFKDDETVRQYLHRFETSRFANVPHIAIEQALEIQLAGYPVRCVIDAVLDTSNIPGAKPVTIVDWKTGKQPSQEQLHARELQLGLYRLAWSQAHNIELADIDACFYYLGEADPARREVHAGQLSEEQITQAIKQSLESVQTN
ncbi:UvrD-helicase domain-containing protein [Arcanobacterium phocisimile]|uniref:DNA 3'-5' helicase n=1 Tax=Arcanobacterium phocisimile TaxID=1302235 RepID=A0ABX7IGJ3_9ACTO|nr:UvrD-helicase domain-containing protein [Arcanobacterium phocisimile]QRV01689.1 UvrD-helicase domain-containing protein [Arcanobacterium phocisimile]